MSTETVSEKRCALCKVMKPLEDFHRWKTARHSRCKVCRSERGDLAEWRKARFWKKVNKSGPTLYADLGPCWIWLAAKLRGYGQFGLGTRAEGLVLAHRFSFELVHGEGSADGLFVCHRCDNPSCVNPDHLFLGTNEDNVRDMLAKGRESHTSGVKGERQHLAKLTGNLVRVIRQMRDAGASLADLASIYQVSETTISRICLRKTWKHVA